MLFLETRLIAILFHNKDVLCQAKSKPSICDDKQTTSITFKTLMKHFLDTFDTLLKYFRNTDEKPWKHWLNTDETLVKTGEKLVKHWRNNGETAVKHW